MLQGKHRKLKGGKTIAVDIFDEEIGEEYTFELGQNISQETTALLIEEITGKVGMWYAPIKKEIAKDIVREFLEATPSWLRGMSTMENTSGSAFCPGCGIKPEKIQKLSDAIKLLV